MKLPGHIPQIVNEYLETLSAQDLVQQDCCWVYRSPIHLCQLGKFGFDQEGLISRAKHNVTTLWENLFNLTSFQKDCLQVFLFVMTFHFIMLAAGMVDVCILRVHITGENEAQHLECINYSTHDSVMISEPVCPS